MAQQKYYPEEIDRKYRKHPHKHNTDLQLEIADFLEENWGPDAKFKSLTEEFDGETSRETLRQVYYAYFGPVDDERTFNEIESETNEPLEEYWKATGELPGESAITLEDEEEEEHEEQATNADLWEAHRTGYQEGYDDGFAKGRRSVLEVLPPEMREELVRNELVEHSAPTKFQDLVGEESE